MANVRNFVKILYFILIQICFSQLKYITQHVFFQAQETVLSAIGGCSVEQCRVLRRVRCGIRLRPAGLRRDKVYR